MDLAPLHFVFYFGASPDKVWEGFVSPESNRIIYSGAELESDLRAGGFMRYFGPGPDGKPMTYVEFGIEEINEPKLMKYTFAMAQTPLKSRVTLELIPETEATKVVVTHDDWQQGDEKTRTACADGWPRILSRLKTLVETGKTFKPH
jgi:uncharacterized protein YndB with AHSA1/START domain